jgi:hypothetical protein
MTNQMMAIWKDLQLDRAHLADYSVKAKQSEGAPEKILARVRTTIPHPPRLVVSMLSPMHYLNGVLSVHEQAAATVPVGLDSVLSNYYY